MSNTTPLPTREAFIGSIIGSQDANGSTVPPMLAGDAAAAALTVLAGNWHDWMRDTPAEPSQLGQVLDDIEELVAILRRTERAIRATYGVPARFDLDQVSGYQIFMYLLTQGFEQPAQQPAGPYCLLRKPQGQRPIEVLIPLIGGGDEIARLLAELDEREIAPPRVVEWFTATYMRLLLIKPLIERGLSATGTKATIQVIENGGEAELQITVPPPYTGGETPRPVEIHIAVIDNEFRAVETIRSGEGAEVDYHEIEQAGELPVAQRVVAHIHAALLRIAFAA
jgi:hypothetical protein